MKKSMMARISKKKMSRSKMKNCGDTKGREEGGWATEDIIYQGEIKKKTCRCGVYEEQIEEKEKDLRHHSEEGFSEQGAEREEQKQPAVARRDDQSERYRLFSHTCPNWRVKTHTQPRRATVPRY